jgi:endonuclease/exonuclease/phosphatase family metal-dependent hydrolase
VHLDTPRWGLEGIMHGQHVDEMRTNIALRDTGSATLINWLIDAPALTIVAGDFNMTTESVIYQKHWKPYFTDAFEEAGFGWGHTKHTRWHGVRIDHILHGPVLRCKECRVCTDVGSDHLPVMAVLSLAKESMN